MYDLLWAEEVYRAFIRKYARAANYLCKMYNIDAIQVVFWLRKDQRKWEHFKMACKRYQTVLEAGNMVNRCRVSEYVNRLKVDPDFKEREIKRLTIDFSELHLQRTDVKGFEGRET